MSAATISRHQDSITFENPFLLSKDIQIKNLVQEAAFRCLKEFVVSLLCVSLLSFYVTPLGMGILFNALWMQLAIKIGLESLKVFALSHSYTEIASGIEWAIGLNFAYWTGYNVQTLIHECGHALASFLVYKQPDPSIYIHPFKGGKTKFYKKGGLSFFGKQIGAVSSTCLIIVSGPGLTLLISSILLLAGLSLKEKHPQLGKTLIGLAILDFGFQTEYAYSALTEKKWYLEHDFVHLAIFGLDPKIAAIGIFSIPLLILAGNFFLKKR